MINKVIKKFILCLLMVTGIAVYGQEATKSDEALVWSLEQCIKYAKENNIQINSLKLSGQSAEQDLALSRLSVLPDLYGSASQSVTNYNNSTGRSSNTNLSGSYGVNSLWTLYQGGYLKNDIRQKDLTVQSANLSVLESENDISLQITQAYLNILLDKESIIYAEDLVKTSQAQVEQAQRKYQVGSIARKDVVQLEAQLASDIYTLTNAQNAERQDKLALKQLLQLPASVSIDVVKPDTVSANGLVPTLSDVQKYAMQNRPEILNSELGIEIAKLSLSKAQSGYKPTITASASIGSNYLSAQTVNSFNQLNNNLNQQAGVTLSIPIFSKGLNKTNVAKGKIAIEQAQLDLQNSRTTLNQTIEQAYINVLNAQSQYQAAEQTLKASQEVYRIANEELRLGAANLVDYYQQRNQYIQAQQSSIQAKYNAALAVRIYQFYLGAPLNIN